MQERVKGYLDKIKQWWKAVNKKAKVLLVGGLFAVLAAIAIVVLVNVNQPYTVLFTGLNQTELTTIVSYLSDNGVTNYRIQKEDTILVPKNQEAQLKADLILQGYPSSGFAYSTYLDNVGSLTTESERNTLFLYELQDRIAAVIRCFDHVKDAYVNIAQGEDHTYVLDSGNVIEATASVTVTMEPGTMLSDGQVEAIRNLVSKSVQGLEIENVAIGDTQGNTYSAGDVFGDIQDVSALKLKLEEQVNNSVRTRVLQVLMPLFGEDNVRVSVTSTVNVDRTFTDSTDYNLEDWAADGSTGGKGIIGTEIYNQEIIRGEDETAGGTVGTESNADLSQYVEDNMNANGDETLISNSGENNYLVDQQNKQVEHLAGTVTDLMVAITINQSAAGGVSDTELYPLVARAAGIGSGDQEEKIAILMGSFYEESPILPAPESLPGWILYAGLAGLGVFLVLLILILLIRRHRKKKRLKRAALEAGLDSAALEDLIQPSAPPEGANIMDMQTEKSMELRQDVRKFAEENPEIAAQMVKNWLREGDEG